MVHLLFILALLCAVGFPASDAAAAAEAAAAAGRRNLPTTNFRATYLARYQHLADPQCKGPPPTVQVFCKGDLVPVSLSSGQVQCSAVSSDSDEAGIVWSGIECATTCNSTSSCESIYLERDQVEGGVFGTIVFQCEGAAVEDVDAFLQYAAGEDGSCAALSFVEASRSATSSRSFHVAQLGVQCPMNESGDSTFLFDDYHSECSSGPSTQVGKFNGRYTCYTGDNCQGGDACNVTFDPLTVYAEHQNFYNCIESINSDGDQPLFGPEPSLGSYQRASPPGNYTATFEASWMLKIDTTYCAGQVATKRIACMNSTKLQNIQPRFDNVDCVLVNDSEMECKESTGDYFVNAWSGVTYDCEGPTLPETVIEYLSEPSFCETGSLTTKKVGHFLQLGVVCDSEIRRDDAFFECGATNDFDLLQGNYSCQSITSFPRGSPAESINVPDTIMRTDYRWSQEPPEDCFSFLATQGSAPAPTSGGLGIPVNPGTPSTTAPVSAPTTKPKPTAGGLGVPVTPGTPSTKPPTGTISKPPSVGAGAPTGIPVTTQPPAMQTTSAPTTAPITPPPGTTYKVNYIGRFQQVQSTGCTASLPSMIVACVGEVRGVGVSNPAIQCNPESLQLDDGRNAVLCESTCVGDECEAIFLSKDGLGGEAPFGEIEFECHGENVEDVDADFIMLKGEPGFCEGSAAEDKNSGYNVNMAQLAVLCPSPDNPLLGSFVIDDAHSDCGIYLNFPLNVDGAYTCSTGRVCGEDACQVTFEQLIVNADPHRFPQCITSSNDSPVPELDKPTQPPRPSGQYSARFIAAWFFLLPEECVGNVSPKKINCLNGSIQLIESTVDSSACNVIDDSTIECVDQGNSGSLTYDCVSNDELPQTHVEYFEGESSCDTFNDQIVERALQLGVLCGESGEENFFFGDLFFECGQDNGFVFEGGSKYTCLSPPTVIPANADNKLFPVNTTEIMTDYRWPLYTSEACFTFKGSRRLSERGISESQINQLLAEAHGLQETLSVRSENTENSGKDTRNDMPRNLRRRPSVVF